MRSLTSNIRYSIYCILSLLSFALPWMFFNGINVGESSFGLLWPWFSLDFSRFYATVVLFGFSLQHLIALFAYGSLVLSLIAYRRKSITYMYLGACLLIFPVFILTFIYLGLLDVIARSSWTAYPTLLLLPGYFLALVQIVYTFIIIPFTPRVMAHT